MSEVSTMSSYTRPPCLYAKHLSKYEAGGERVPFLLPP